MHQIPDLPHEGLMLVDDRLRGGAILVEPGRGHLQLDFADGRLGFRDARLQRLDPLLPRLQLAGLFPRFGVDSLFFLVRRGGFLLATLQGSPYVRLLLALPPSCLGFLPSCLEFLPSCLEFLPSCLEFLPSCLEFLPSCLEFLPSRLPAFLPCHRQLR